MELKQFLNEHRELTLLHWNNLIREKFPISFETPFEKEEVVTFGKHLYEIVTKQNIHDVTAEELSHIVHAKFSLDELLFLVNSFEEAVSEVMLLTDGLSKNELILFVQQIAKISSYVNEQIINTYNQQQTKVIQLQKLALQELSTPLIPVFHEITVLPLIGTVDTERAKNIMENLLEGIVKQKSKVVLIDITGIPVIDTMVAHHIIQTAKAVRLIGVKCMLVGIRPEIAQTIVSLGVDMTDLITTNTLQNGMKMALEVTGKKVVRRIE